MLYSNCDLKLSYNDYRKYRGVIVLKNGAYREYSKKLEEYHKYSKVIRNTVLKEVNPEDVEKRLQDGDDIVRISDEGYYLVTKARWWFTAGYFAVDDTLFIRVRRRILPFIILLFMLIGLLLYPRISGYIHLDDERIPDGGPTSEWNPDLDPDSSDYTGRTPTEQGEQESIKIPGFFKFTATSGGSNVQLYNPDVNTVYFKYEISNIISSKIVRSFSTEVEANAFIADKQISYRIVVGDNGGFDYIVSDSFYRTIDVYSVQFSGTSFDVVCDTYEPVYVTGLVEPGKQILWNVYDYLSKGEYTLKFKISTYDLETGAECYGAIQTVEGIVR